MLGDPVVGPPGEEEVSHMVGCSQRLVQLGRGVRGGEGRKRKGEGRMGEEEKRGVGRKGVEKGVYGCIHFMCLVNR